MRRNGLIAIAAVAAFASAVPAEAQSWRADIGINGGGSFYTPMLSSDAFASGGESVKFAPSWLVGSQLGFWFTPRIGIRANGTYTDDKLKAGSETLYGDVNLWSLTGDLLFRFKEPAATFTHMEFLPYLALGAGGKWINPAANAYVATGPDGTTKSGVPFVCGSGITSLAGNTCVGPATGLGTNFFLTQATRLMGLVGLGGDLRLARNVGLRLEVGDRLYKPQVWALAAPSPTTTNVSGFLPFPALSTATSTDNQAKLVHELYGQIGLELLLGVAAPPVVAVTPTPAPPPPPPPPPPAPTTTTSTVCVVSPTSPTGLMMDTVTINTTTNDTTVIVNGSPVALRTAFTTVPVAAGAPWYVQGQPLIIGTGRNAPAYVSFGTARNIDMGDLVYVGTVNGLPVYANRTDVSNLTIPSPPGEIATTPALVTGLRQVQVLYVPLSPYGCNFQPLQLQQAVRKVRG